MSGSKFFKDKIALITGGSRGLGLAIARQICARGGKVALIARDAEELARAKTELDRLATDVLTIPCDLLESAQIQSAVQQVLQHFSKRSEERSVGKECRIRGCPS